MTTRHIRRGGPVTMFANRYETAAFWACVAGLLLVLAITGVRLATGAGTEPTRHAATPIAAPQQAPGR